MADEQISLEPTAEKPRKLNKAIFAAFGVVVVFATMYFMSPSSDEETSKENEAKPQTEAALSEGAITSMKKTNEAMKAEAAAKDPQAHDHTDEGLGEATHTADPSNRQGSNSQYAASGSYASSAPATAPPPVVVSPYEKFQEEKNKRTWAREEQEENERRQSNKAANGSRIFFTVSVADEKANKDRETAKPSNINDYYNSLGSDGYVSVVRQGGR